MLVHPECPMEVVDLADISGSTGKDHREVESAPPARNGRSAPNCTW
jgi:quinolinate synthase